MPFYFRHDPDLLSPPLPHTGRRRHNASGTASPSSPSAWAGTEEDNVRRVPPSSRLIFPPPPFFLPSHKRMISLYGVLYGGVRNEGRITLEYLFFPGPKDTEVSQCFSPPPHSGGNLLLLPFWFLHFLTVPAVARQKVTSSSTAFSSPSGDPFVWDDRGPPSRTPPLFFPPRSRNFSSRGGLS